MEEPSVFLKVGNREISQVLGWSGLGRRLRDGAGRLSDFFEFGQAQSCWCYLAVGTDQPPPAAGPNTRPNSLTSPLPLFKLLPCPQKGPISYGGGLAQLVRASES